MDSSSSAALPVLFIGHGNPMNALASNAYTRALRRTCERLPTPQAILCISAHWMTKDLKMTAMENPRTIHDFYGFPRELFAIQYPAPGAPAIANEVVKLLAPDISVGLDMEWGLDHGAWSVLKHMYPDASVPVIQLSLAVHQPADFHFTLGEKLAPLKHQGILIVGSGNVVHNLRHVDFSLAAPALPNAESFNRWLQTKIDAKDVPAMIHEALKREDGRWSIPSPDHWYPFLVTLGAANKEFNAEIIYDGIENSSISMKSLLFY